MSGIQACILFAIQVYICVCIWNYRCICVCYQYVLDNVSFYKNLTSFILLYSIFFQNAAISTNFVGKNTQCIFKILMKIISLIYFRQQVTEIIFVLKAVSTLIDSLKKTQPENGKCLKLGYHTGHYTYL